MKVPTEVKGNSHWKVDMDDLRARALDVAVSPSLRRGRISALEAAHCLAGVMSWVHRGSGLDAMQRAAAELVRHEAAWGSKFSRLPTLADGTVDRDVALIAVLCRGLIELAGADHLRAALSFWAVEQDPAEWAKVFGSG